MGEWSKKIGEYGENLVEKILSVVGWTDLQKGIEIKCSNEEHTNTKGKPLKTHGIDFLYSYLSPLVDGQLNNVIISSKFQAKKYPNNPTTKFKDFMKDLIHTIDCFDNSTQKENVIQGFNFTSVNSVGVLYNEKTISREIAWASGDSIFIQDILSVNEDGFIKKYLPTCELERPIHFTRINDNQNYLTADFMLIRHDRNKSWFEQTNKFPGKIEIINEQGKGHIRITYTSSETKDLAEQIVKSQVKKYKQKGLISEDEKLKKIIFSEFTNEKYKRYIY